MKEKPENWYLQHFHTCTTIWWTTEANYLYKTCTTHVSYHIHASMTIIIDQSVASRSIGCCLNEEAAWGGSWCRVSSSLLQKRSWLWWRCWLQCRCNTQSKKSSFKSGLEDAQCDTLSYTQNSWCPCLCLFTVLWSVYSLRFSGRDTFPGVNNISNDIPLILLPPYYEICVWWWWNDWLAHPSGMCGGYSTRGRQLFREWVSKFTRHLLLLSNPEEIDDDEFLVWNSGSGGGRCSSKV